VSDQSPKKTGRPAKAPGVAPQKRGRPSLPPELIAASVIQVRVTESQKAQYEALGGKAWLIKALQRSKAKK
jgi:hypothetical protein